MPQASSPKYRVLTASFLIQSIVIGMMFGYGVFFKVLEDEEVGWSRTLLSGASSTAILVMGLFAKIAGQLSDRFGPRWVITATSLTTGVGYFLMSSMTEPWQLLICFGFLVGLGFATHDVVTLSAVSSWFPRQRGMTTGIVKTGSACGQVVVPLLATWLIAQQGWRNALALLGVLAMVSLVALSQMMQRKSTKEGDDKAPRSDQVNGIAFREACRDRLLWTFCAIQFCFLPSLMAIPLHFVAHASDLGLATEQAALTLSTLGAASIVGRLVVGYLIDRFGVRTILCSCLAILAVAIIALRLTVSPVALFPIALVYGIAHGGLFTAVSPSVAEYFGMRAHGSIFGTIVFFGTVSGAAGPIVAGMIFDYQKSYDMAFTILAALAIAGFALAMSLPKRSISADA